MGVLPSHLTRGDLCQKFFFFSSTERPPVASRTLSASGKQKLDKILTGTHVDEQNETTNDGWIKY